MSPENEKILKDKFPNLYSQDFYFSCDDGWFELIKNLSQDITNINQTITAFQVKEKFGALRFYTDGCLNEKIQELISLAETISFKTCEICGSFGKTINYRNYLKTYCEIHSKNPDKR